MKKFSKKSMLSFLTVSAIVATTVGSFAVWDPLETTSTGTLSVASPIVVSTAEMAPLTETRTWDEVPTYTGNVEFTVEGLAKPEDAQLTLTTALKEGDTIIDSSKYDVEITQTDADSGLTGGVDSNVGASNEYQVVVKPKADATDLGGKTLKLEVTGTLAKKANP